MIPSRRDHCKLTTTVSQRKTAFLLYQSPMTALEATPDSLYRSRTLVGGIGSADVRIFIAM